MMLALTHAPTATAASRTIAMLAHARKLPLRVACIGEARYLDDESATDDFCAARTVVLGACESLDDAMAFIERLSRQRRIDIRDDSAVSFSPRLFTAQDDEHCLVIAGEAGPNGVIWYDPVASDGEARRVVQAASKLRGQAFRETGSGNHSAARALCFRAAALEGRLVHADWREPAQFALRFLSEGARRYA